MQGRFKDSFDDVLTSVTELEIVPPKVLGAVVCVAVLERTGHPKARVLAYQHIGSCVQAVGLSGLGKKGLLLVSKCISTENLAENKGAVMDLMMVILSKMNGDTDRLARICGPSNLSDKARKLVEERWQKKGGSVLLGADSGDAAGRRTAEKEEPARRQQYSRLRKPGGGIGTKTRRAETATKEPTPASMSTHEKLRTLQLKLGSSSVSSSVSATRPFDLDAVSGPFTFSFEKEDRVSKGLVQNDHAGATTLASSTMNSPTKRDFAIAASEEQHQQEATNSSLDQSGEHAEPEVSDAVNVMTTTGAAASLRARLMKIREKHRAQEETVQPSSVPTSESADASENRASTPSASPQSLANEAFGSTDQQNEERTEDELYASLSRFEELTDSSQIEEDDDAVVDCIARLKRFHTALSKTLEFDIDPALASLRTDVCREATETVEHLTR